MKSVSLVLVELRIPTSNSVSRSPQSRSLLIFTMSAEVGHASLAQSIRSFIMSLLQQGRRFFQRSYPVAPANENTAGTTSHGCISERADRMWLGSAVEKGFQASPDLLKNFSGVQKKVTRGLYSPQMLCWRLLTATRWTTCQAKRPQARQQACSNSSPRAQSTGAEVGIRGDKVAVDC